MFRTGAPARGEEGPAARELSAATVPRLIRAAWRDLGPGRPYEPDPRTERFLTEAALPYDEPFRRDLFAAAPRHTSVELAAEALGALGPLDEVSPQVVVVAYATPDFEHSELVAAWLKHQLPGDPLSFGVSDQGVLAPFTALRVALEYARRGGLERALVVIVDQSSQPFERPTTGQAAVDGDGAVALLLEWGGGRESIQGMAQGPLTGDRALPPVPGSTNPNTLVTGPGLSEAPAAAKEALAELSDRVGHSTGRSGLPCTGLWATLLDAGTGGTGAPVPGRSVLADYDHGLGLMAYCTLDVGEVKPHADVG